MTPPQDWYSLVQTAVLLKSPLKEIYCTRLVSDIVHIILNMCAYELCPRAQKYLNMLC